MSFNIVDLVKDQVSGSLMSQMGNMLGDESSRAAGAVDSAVPALLEGLRNSTSSTSGADKLFQAVQDQDDGLLDNLSSMLGGGQSTQMVENGNSMLGSLFGSGGLGSLSGAISAVSGLSKGGTGSLMGMLAPVVIGVLKRKVLGNGLNAGGLASMLMGQKDNIARGMPVGLSDQLNTSGFLSSISGSIGGGASGMAAAATGAVAAAGAAAAGAAGSVADTAGNVVGGARDAVSGAAGAVADTAGNVVGGVKDAAGGAVDAAGNAAGSVGDAASGAAGAVADTAGNVVGGARDAVGGAAGAVGDAASGAAGAVADTAGNVAGGVKDAASGAVGAAGNVVSGAGDAVGSAASGAANMAGNAAGAVGDAASGATDSIGDAGREAASSGGGFMRWLLPLLGVLLLGWLGLKFFGGNADEQLSEAGTTTETAATAAAGDALSGDVSAVSDGLTGFFGSATETFTGITDADSATAALPQLQEMGTSLGGLSEKFQSVPEAARGPLTDIVSKGTESLNPLIEKAMGLPGVGDILKPAVGPIQEALQGLGG